MEFVKERLGKWIISAIIITIGVLCIVAGAKLGQNSLESVLNAQDTIDAISMVLGIVCLVVGGLSFCLAVLFGVLAKRSFGAVALPGVVLIAVGASIVVLKYAYSLIELLLKVSPYLLIAVGGVLLLDAVFTFVLALRSKKAKPSIVAFVCTAVVAVTAIVLGALCIGDNPVIEYGVQLIVFGVIVILSGLLKLLSTFVKLPETVVVVAEKK